MLVSRPSTRSVACRLPSYSTKVVKLAGVVPVLASSIISPATFPSPTRIFTRYTRGHVLSWEKLNAPRPSQTRARPGTSEGRRPEPWTKRGSQAARLTMQAAENIKHLNAGAMGGAFPGNSGRRMPRSAPLRNCRKFRGLARPRVNQSENQAGESEAPSQAARHDETGLRGGE